MGSDWQYIEDHMGGHDEDGLPNFMNEPGFYDESYFYEKKQKSIKKTRNTIKKDDELDTIDHMTHIDNLDSILKYGLLSHNNSYKKIDISNKEVNSRRNKIEPIYNKNLHDYVPFYFNPRNAMLYRNQKMFDENIIILGFSKDLLLLEGSIFTNGNAASDDTIYSNDINYLLKMDWDNIYSRSWYGADNESFVKWSMMAEVLVYKKVELKKLISIYCSSSKAKQHIENNYQLGNIEVSVYSEIFF